MSKVLIYNLAGSLVTTYSVSKSFKLSLLAKPKSQMRRSPLALTRRLEGFRSLRLKEQRWRVTHHSSFLSSPNRSHRWKLERFRSLRLKEQRWRVTHHSSFLFSPSRSHILRLEGFMSMPTGTFASVSSAWRSRDDTSLFFVCSYLVFFP
jgi:hypothetical protein